LKRRPCAFGIAGSNAESTIAKFESGNAFAACAVASVMRKPTDTTRFDPFWPNSDRFGM